MKRIVLALAALALLCGTAKAQAPPELRQAFERVFADPTDVHANLDYARAAEKYGQKRLAIEAYSRVLQKDPGNLEAGRGVARLMGTTLPPTTDLVAIVGAEFATNPLLRRSGSGKDLVPSARVLVTHERALLGLRWRAVGDLYANRYTVNNPQISFAYVGGRAGPLIPLTRDWRLWVAASGGAAYLDGHFLFAESGAQASLERTTAGWFRGVDVRAAYVYVAQAFSNRNGFVLDVSPHFAWGNVLTKGDGLTLRVGYRFNAVAARNGGKLNDFPGHFHQAGMSAEYLLPIRKSVYAGPTAAIYHRWFLGQEVRHPGESGRRDLFIAPGAKIIVREVLPRTDLVGFYRFEHNSSTVGAENFRNHRFGAQLVWRFSR